MRKEKKRREEKKKGESSVVSSSVADYLFYLFGKRSRDTNTRIDSRVRVVEWVVQLPKGFAPKEWRGREKQHVHPVIRVFPSKLSREILRPRLS